MRTFVLACVLIAMTAAVYTNASALRLRRDVSELVPPAYEYLPPAVKFAIAPPAETTTAIPAEVTELITEAIAAPKETAILGDDGYEYKTVRRLKYRYRTRRDVSHLAREYLPPNNDYLPPPPAKIEAEEEINDVAAPLISSEYLPPPVNELPLEADTVVVEAAPKVANEYLPPSAEISEPVVEAQKVTEAPATVAPAASLKSSDAEVLAPAPEESAILAEDGYHYKQPQEEPAQLNLAQAAEYLPPVVGKSGVDGDGDDTVIVEGPEDGAALSKDGYRYRTVKRLRF